jgi:hypothetical protein
MPTILRSRLALLSLLGIFLIPIGVSSLRGLTHVLTCRERVRTPFTLIIPQAGQPEAVTSTRITRGEDSICGGLALELGTRVAAPDRMAMVVPITNESPYLWRGTVQMELDNTAIPVDIGEVPAGETVSDTVTFRLDPGSHEVSGSLLIGP